MENEQKKLVLLASEVTIAEEDEKLNPVFLSIRMKLADSVGNRNDQGVTAAFISDLIKRQDEFECLPFYADVHNLLARNYDNLGHMYNRVTRRFSSTQIGSLTNFYSETDNNGVISLYATARVPKREQDICIRLAELYELGKLNVSFEVRYNPEYTIEKDGVLFIDANEENALTGIAVVSVPACPDATALDMVASVVDDSEKIVAESEEQTGERGETENMEKENITAEVTEEQMHDETEAQETAQEQVVVAEGEGASESSGEGASESGAEGASEPGGEGASEGGGAGASGDDDSGDEPESAADVEPVIDPSEQKKIVAEETQAEVIEHAVDTHESIEQCPYTGEPVHVIEYHERIIETLEDAGALIAELDQQIAELTEIKSKYDTIIAEQEAKALAEKRDNAKAFAEKQGLNIQDTVVAEAIEKLDYGKIAELTMAEERDSEKEEPTMPVITLASFVEMEVSDDKYGGLLSRKNK